MIGRKDFWGKGFAFEAWSLILEYAFNRLGLRKISAGATESNLASAAVLRKLGFQVEGIFRRERLIEGKYEDGIHMGIFRDEFHKFIDLDDADSLTETP
jgi:RimJ/RimL family protein N-acetyltransferase